MEKVSDEQYGTPVQAQRSASAAPARSLPGVSVQPTPAQRAIGDIAPKLVELTDNVLCRRCVGTSATFPTRSQPGDRQRADRDEPSRPASISPRQSARKWRDPRRVARDHYPLGVLRGLTITQLPRLPWLRKCSRRNDARAKALLRLRWVQSVRRVGAKNKHLSRACSRMLQGESWTTIKNDKTSI